MTKPYTGPGPRDGEDLPEAADRLSAESVVSPLGAQEYWRQVLMDDPKGLRLSAEEFESAWAEMSGFGGPVRNPTEVTDDPWIYAVSLPSSDRDHTRSGKWLLYTPVKDHDVVWEKIRIATESGSLGDSAKAATSRPSGFQASQRVLVTCVYTHDFEDLDDVRRVLVALRELGFGGRLSYKTDDDTRKGTYGRGAAIYVSQPGSLDFENRR